MIEAGEIGLLAVQYELEDPELDALELQDGPLDGGREPDGMTATVSPSIASSMDPGRNSSSSEPLFLCPVGNAPIIMALAVSDDLLLELSMKRDSARVLESATASRCAFPWSAAIATTVDHATSCETRACTCVRIAGCNPRINR